MQSHQFEGGQVFYGENEFKFPHYYDFLDIGRALPPHNLAWVKELTMSIPFPVDDVVLRHCRMVDIKTLPSKNTTLDLRSHRVDLLANREMRYVLDVLANAPCLQTLHFIIPPMWKPNNHSTWIKEQGPNEYENTPNEHG